MAFANYNTPSGSASAGLLIHGLGATVSAQALRTGGYVLVPDEQRGSIDSAAGTADITGTLTLSHALRDGGRGFLRLSSFGESRRNGTPLQINDTRISSAD